MKRAGFPDTIKSMLINGAIQEYRQKGLLWKATR